MSRLNVDASALKDTRFVRLARLLKLPGGKYEARGRVEELWWLCTDRETYTLKAIDVAIAMDLEDEASTTHALLEAELAEVVEHEILVGEDFTPTPGVKMECLRIRGTEGRIEWLARKRRAGAKGGKSKGGSTSNGASKQNGASASSTNGECLTPPAPAPAPTKRDLLLIEDERVARFDFDAVYRRYPQKKGKAKGMAKIAKLVTTQADYERLVASVELMAAEWDPKSDEIQYCPYWDSYVNGKRWLDDEPPLPKRRNGAKKGMRPIDLLEAANAKEMQR